MHGFYLICSQQDLQLGSTSIQEENDSMDSHNIIYNLVYIIIYIYDIIHCIELIIMFQFCIDYCIRWALGAGAPPPMFSELIVT